MRPVCTPTSPLPGPRRWLAAIAWLAAAVSAGAALPADPADLADPPPDCGLLWRVTARLDAVPRQLQVEIAFDAGGRSSTNLRLPGGWAEVTETTAGQAGQAGQGGQPTAAAEPRLLPVPGAPTLRQVLHRPGERVRLQWRLVPAAGSQASGVRLSARWLAFSGQSVLPMPLETDERAPPNACIALAGLAPGGRWVSSHGAAETPQAWLRLAAGAAPLAVRVQQALLAGGALQVHSALADGSPLTVALPEGPWRFDAETLHRAAAQAIAAQRRYWGSGPAGAQADGGLPWLLLLMPADAGQTGGTAWQRGLALQAPPDLTLPSAGFDLLMTQGLARAWVTDRFGPLAHAGRGDEGQRAWFGEGVADFLTHRTLLRQGLWTPDDYAVTLNRKISATLRTPGPEPVLANDPTALASLQGEWLALRWHAALLAAGRPGLEAQLQRLLVPAVQARREGPISAPLATHRLLAALRPALGDTALADLKRHVEQGEPVEFGPAALGPCFVGRRQVVGRWQLGFDPASLTTGVLQAVEPGSSAEAAGLRNGLLLRGHAWMPGDATQTVWLRLQDGSASPVEVSYLPAAPPLRELPRYDSLPQALQRPDCQAWLGPAAHAAAGAAAWAPGAPGRAAATSGGRTAAAPAPARAGAKAKAKVGPKAKAGKAKSAGKGQAPAAASPKPRLKSDRKTASKPTTVQR